MSSVDTNSIISEYEVLIPQLARKIIKRFNVRVTNEDDLVSSGYLALVEAAQKYEPEKKESFKNYLILRIRGAMIDHLRSSSVLSGKSRKFVKALSAIQLLREEDLLADNAFFQNNKEPEDNLAHILDLAAKGAIAFRLSLDEAQSDLDCIVDERPNADERLEQYADGKVIREFVNKLPLKERVVVENYYFEDKSFVQIAREHEGMTKSWVSKLHSRALNNLRKMVYESY